MHVLIALVLLPGFMASSARGAPLSAGGTLVEDPRFQETVQRSLSLTQKILLDIPGTHSSCVYMENLRLNSSENAKFGRVAASIRIPRVPEVKVVSENSTLEQSLRQMYEGAQLHRASLNIISPRLENKEKVVELMDDIRDLAILINKMLKMAQTEPSAQPSPTPVDLDLPGEYEVQVAAHLTLVHLQSFSQDVVRCLRTLDQSNEEDTES